KPIKQVAESAGFPDADDKSSPDLEKEADAPIEELKSVLATELSTDTTQYYLNKIGKKALFTVEEEVH
ncbi:MAG: hypothetical protein RLZZ384_845, partial [Pseudomonadota bacterium]